MTGDLSSLRDELSSLDDDLVAFRRDLHRYPEIAFEEHRTSARVAERLTQAGLEVTSGIAKTGLVAVLRGERPGRVIAWRADMDALPLEERADVPYRSVVDGAMHACGHDGHTAIATIVAEALARRRADIGGTAVFIFQPAEEVFGGARPMLDAGILDTHRVEEIFGLHLTSRVPVGRVEACPGLSMAAADVLEIEVRGRGGHGASQQHVVNPFIVAGAILSHLEQLVSGAVQARDTALLSIGQIVGGSAFNIVPDLIAMRGSLRTLRESDRRELLERLTSYVATLAAEQRATVTVRELACCPALVNSDEQTAHVHRCAADELGDGNVEAGAPVMASDDMALFLAERPGCYFRVGAALAGREPTLHHSASFEIDERGLSVGARVAAATLLGALR